MARCKHKWETINKNLKRNDTTEHVEDYAMSWNDVLERIERNVREGIPAVDAHLERYGEWIFGEHVTPFCSVCLKDAANGVMSNFCPNCGARIEKSRDSRWISTEEELPPENVSVDTKIDDSRGIRNETHLVRRNNLWFFPDFSMYVYYTPTHWRYSKKL